MNKLPCELVQDILPLYADKLTSERTQKEVETHLADCEKCRRFYEEMTGEPEAGGRLEEFPEIAYFRQVKRRNHRRIFLLLLLLLAVGAGLLLARLFVLGFPVGSYYTEVTVKEELIQVEGEILDSSVAYSHYRIREEEDGTKQLVVYGTLASPWRKSGSFHLKVPLPETELVINRIRILPDQTLIEERVQRLFECKNPYLGNASADGQLARNLGISEKLGSFQISLQTAEEPYSWMLEFQEAWSAEEEGWRNRQMEKYACVLLSLVGNCSRIDWSYQVAGELRTKSIDVDSANRLASGDIKAFGESMEQLQKLFLQLGM